MKKLIIFEEQNKYFEFSVKLSSDIAHSLKIYCETIEIDPEMFIKDTIVKDLIQTYVNLQSEEHIYLGDKYSKVKKPLIDWLKTMELVIEKEENYEKNK